MSDPSVAVAEAFKQFLQVTVSALRAYEHGNRARLDQAEDDLRVLRRERDDSLRDLNACKEQTRAWAADVNRWKAEADSALIVNKHQAELISQLRQEAQQWKDQCLRLEETLRGEIKSWKDQFLRIDAEHTRLLNQLSASSSSRTTLVNTPKRVPILAAGESSTTSTATKRCKSASSSTARADKDRPLPTTHSPTKTLPFPRVLRRVQAVIEVPVKEEEEEIDGSRVDWPPDSAILQPTTSTPTGTTSGGTGAGAGASTSSRGGGGGGGRSAKRRKSSASSHQRSLVVPPSTEEWRSFVVDDEEGEEPPSDEDEEEEAGDDGGEYVEDEEEVEIAIANGTPATGGRKTVPWGKKHVGHEPDDEDDELMMYAKDNPHRVRPPHENPHPHPPPVRAPARRKSITDVTSQRLSATNNNNNASAAKRRTTETGPGGSARTKRRR